MKDVYLKIEEEGGGEREGYYNWYIEIYDIQDMVEKLTTAFWVYKKDESRKIRIETLSYRMVSPFSLI